MYVLIYDESHVFIRDSSIFFTFEPTPYSVLSPVFLRSILERMHFAVFSFTTETPLVGLINEAKG